MTVLITGGAGFIGVNLVRYLLKHTDHRVRVVDALTYASNKGALPRHSRLEFRRGDISVPRVADAAVSGCDYVINLASETHIDRSIHDPEPFLRSDFMGTARLLEAWRKHAGVLFVQVSTSEVYGTAQRTPMDEDHPTVPQSPYAAAKLGADRMALAYWHTYKTPVCVVRPFNQYGPHQFPEKLIPFLTTQSLTLQPLYLYGNGGATRDWCHVSDLCRAFALLLEQPDKHAGQVYNVGAGNEHSAFDIAQQIVYAVRGEPSAIKYRTDRPGHVMRLVCDHTKFSRATRWQPRIDVLDGVRTTVKWYQQNERWWRGIRGRREFRDYYKRNYPQ